VKSSGVKGAEGTGGVDWHPYMTYSREWLKVILDP
jgi:hypothetical protein